MRAKDRWIEKDVRKGGEGETISYRKEKNNVRDFL